MPKLEFDTGINSKGIEKELNEVKRDIEKATATKADATEKKLPLLKDAEELGVKLDNAKKKLLQLQQESERINFALGDAENPVAFLEAHDRKDANASELKTQNKEVEKLQKKWDALNNQIDKYDAKIQRADQAIEEGTDRAAELSGQLESPGKKLAEGFEEAEKKAKKLEQRVMKLAARVFVFSMITKILRKAREYFGELLSKNQEYQDQLARLNAAFATAFQPLYEVAVPILLTIMRILTAIVSVAANVLSILFGKSLSQSAENAKNLNKEEKALKGVGKAAKDASRQLAGFDEINQLSDNSADASTGGVAGTESGTGMNFEDFSTEEYKQKIDELTVYLSGALLALGAILAFSGANIPLGIGLMAAGAISLAAVVAENWGAVDEKLKGAITKVMLTIGAAAFAIGAIITFSGAHMGLGIALMIAGAASMTGAAALNWNTISEKLRGPLGAVVALVSGYLIAVGAILAFTGANIPLGIALIAAGTAGLVTVGALNWNAILDCLKEAWGSITSWWNSTVAPKLTLSFWQDKFSSIADGLKNKIRDGVNSGIAMLNRFISWINSAMHLRWGGLSAFGKTIIPAGSYQLLNIQQIPMLAKGAVIPPNAPFAAILGDQRSGNNIEAPEDLIRRIVREESGSGDIDMWDQVIRLMERIYEKDNGVYLDGKKISDTVNRYNHSRQRTMGV